MGREYAAQREGEGLKKLSPAQILSFPKKLAKNLGYGRLYLATRQESLRTFEQTILSAPSGNEKPVAIDVGAGFGWLTARLVARGFTVIALDACRDSAYGLGAIEALNLSPESALALQWDLELPPVADGVADLIVFNASFHYATDFTQTLIRWRKCLKPSGQLIIMDTPIAPSSRRDEARGTRDVFARDLDEAFAAAELTCHWIPVRRGIFWLWHKWLAFRGKTAGFSLPMIVGKSK